MADAKDRADGDSEDNFDNDDSPARGADFNIQDDYTYDENVNAFNDGADGDVPTKDLNIDDVPIASENDLATYDEGINVVVPKFIDMDDPLDFARYSFSQQWYFLPFLIFAMGIALLEPIVIALGNTGFWFNVQYVLLAAGTGTFMYGFTQTLSFYKGDEGICQKMWKMCEGETKTELITLALGWVLLYDTPGVAALRCFRVFRFLWYFELFVRELPEDYDPAEDFFSPTKAGQLCVQYIEGMSNEIFSAKSNGGIVVIGLFFFLNYMFALVFWYQEPLFQDYNGGPTYCSTLLMCWVTMLRLSLYDGNGLDYLQMVIVSGVAGGAYGILLIVFTVASAIVLYNGLIGIFGAAFLASIDSDGDGIAEYLETKGEVEAKSTANAVTGTEENSQSKFTSLLTIQLLTTIQRDLSNIKSRIGTAEEHLAEIQTDVDHLHGDKTSVLEK